MEGGAKGFDMLKDLRKSDKKAVKAVAHSVREDGAYIEAGENDNLIVQKLEANKDAVGIFGFSFLDQNSDKLQGATVGGVEPTFENIADGQYGISRSLFFYVKDAHVGEVTGIKEFIAEFTSEKAFGEYGYLTEKGLIPLSEAERAEVRKEALALAPLKLM
jgi:phosphate transport system substrate-binding protein